MDKPNSLMNFINFIFGRLNFTVFFFVVVLPDPVLAFVMHFRKSFLLGYDSRFSSMPPEFYGIRNLLASLSVSVVILILLFLKRRESELSRYHSIKVISKILLLLFWSAITYSSAIVDVAKLRYDRDTKLEKVK